MARDLTQGPISPLLLKLAVPGVFSLLGITANNFIDGIWVGKLGPKALAAISPSSFAIWMIASAIDIMPVGLLAIVSRLYGEKSLDKASEISQKIVQFTMYAALVFTLIGFVSSKYILSAVGISAEAISLGNIYLQILALGLPAFFLTEALSCIFRAVGDTAIPMKATLIAVAINMVLDPLLIFGIGLFPKWGIGGAAFATILAHYLAMGWIIYKIYKGKLPFSIFGKKILPIDFSLIWKVSKIGIPVSIGGVIFAGVYMALARIGAPFGDFVVASFRVGQLVESVSFMVCFGFGQAVASMVGQNLGAQKQDRAEKAALSGVAIVSAITFIFSIVFYFFSSNITSVFTKDIPTSTAAVYYLKIIALSQIFMGLEFVLENVFYGAGNTVPPMIISTLGTLIRIPLAILLVGPLGFGYPGVYWAITISTFVKGTAIAVWFRFGKWKFKAL
jgi:putative MATE family efflux protein